jgi:CheY-like chemotaxis protein
MPTARTYLLVGVSTEPLLASIDHGLAQHTDLTMVRRARAHSVADALRFLRAERLPLRTLVVALHEPPALDAVELLRAVRAAPELSALGVVVVDVAPMSAAHQAAFALHAAGVLPRPASAEAIHHLAGTVHRYWSMVELP